MYCNILTWDRPFQDVKVGGGEFLSPQSIEITLIDPKENKYSDPAAFSKNDGKKNTNCS